MKTLVVIISLIGSISCRRHGAYTLARFQDKRASDFSSAGDYGPRYGSRSLYPTTGYDSIQSLRPSYPPVSPSQIEYGFTPIVGGSNLQHDFSHGGDFSDQYQYPYNFHSHQPIPSSIGHSQVDYNQHVGTFPTQIPTSYSQPFPASPLPYTVQGPEQYSLAQQYPLTQHIPQPSPQIPYNIPVPQYNAIPVSAYSGGIPVGLDQAQNYLQVVNVPVNQQLLVSGQVLPQNVPIENSPVPSEQSAPQIQHNEQQAQSVSRQ